jgi:succinate--hydroxymethylglutarate CoA-transferase
LKKYQLDYETLRKINPGLIYASITGYGQTGPYSQRAGYDVMVEAEFGLMHITGSRDGPPVKVGVAVTDLTTGLYTSNSIMAALLARAKTGRGQHIDAALSDCQTATLANIASSCLISGESDTGRWGTAHRESTFREKPRPQADFLKPPSFRISHSRPRTEISCLVVGMTASSVYCVMV